MNERGLAVDHTTVSDCVKTQMFSTWNPISRLLGAYRKLSFYWYDL